MTEQSLIEYAKAGDPGAIGLLGNDYPGIDWKYAITHINGRWLPGNDISLVWNEMVKVHQETGKQYDEIQAGLQAALDKAHEPNKNLELLSPAGRPWDFNFKHKLKFGKGSNRVPAKKKRKK